MALLRARRIRALPTGLRHGTVTALVGGHRYEITTLRRDVACRPAGSAGARGQRQGPVSAGEVAVAASVTNAWTMAALSA